ncbi:MAG: glycine-rich domain-containing protein [Bdellovibrionia bacterium]
MRKAQCRVDSSTWGDCNSLTGHTITGLQDGERKIEIRGIDIAGNASNILIEDVRVDNSGPLVTFITTPASTTSLVSADFSFNVFDPGSDVATVECQLDGGAFSACTSPYFIAGPLNEGAHQFVVKATDNLGNEGFSTPFNWNVDLTSPFAPIFDANEDGPRRPTWEWTSGGGGGIGSYRFKLNDNDLSSGSTTQNATSFTPSYDLSFGTHTLYAQESDAAGNWSPSGSKSFYIKCSQGEYLDGGNCQVCPTGTYQESPSLNSTCTTTPQGSYIAVTGASAPSACPFNSNTTGTGATSLADCLGNAGYFNCEDGICNPVGAPFFSPTLSNTRSACPTNQYTAGSGTDADDITDCRAGLDFYDHDSDPATAAIAVGNGFYSAYRVNTRDVCTNKPANATVVLYSGSGAGSNNCPISAVVDCSPGFIPNGTTCFDNSPSAIHFTNLNNQERNTLTESNTVVVNGFDGPLDATCSGCSGIARNGVWGGTSVSGFMPGDTLSIRLTTSNSFSTDVLATVTLGSTTSSNWLVGTRAAYDCNDANIGLVAHGASANAYSEATPLPGTSCESIKEVRSCFDGSLSGTLTHPTCQEGCGSTIFGDLRSGEGGTAYSTQTPAGTCASVSQTRTCNNGVLSGSFAQTTCFNACNSGSFVNIPHGTSVNAYSVSAIYSGTCDPYKEVRTCTNGTLSGSYANATCTLGHIVATGGAISDINVGGRMYRVHSFTNVGSESFNVTQIGALGGTVEYLIVAGGGGGGGRGGGGGAGGVITGATSVGVANYTVTVGGGGRGEGNGGSKTNGGNSSAIGLTAIGGGAGGNYHLGAGNSGGSGGGTGGGTDTSAGSSSWGAGTAGQGYRGGGTGTNSYAGGGGGGAGGAGGTSGPAGNGVGGNGGPGIASSIRTGANQWYGGGGGGAGIAGGVAGAGGSGGGGNGGHPGQNAAANTGGGGGGSGSSGGVWTAGGNGGSGIVIIRYPLEP